jgi:S1-C subfamily serine protease
MNYARLAVIPSLPLLAAAAAACGGATSDTTSPQLSHAVVEPTREVASSGRCLGRRRILEALGVKLPELPASASPEHYKVQPWVGEASPSDAYRVGAPATVLIRTRDGLGTGVVVDPSGLVLTNYHVVDAFQQPDLTIKVSLELPEVQSTGRMARSSKVYQATVVKTDSLKDLALVKIADPPAGLPSIHLADSDPQVGENVLSIGNAGIGLLWAAKTCSVSKIGDQTRDTSMLEVGDCGLKDPSDTEQEATRHTEQCEARKRQIREMVEGATQGLSVQTSCNVNRGDSGGPLLNLRGELVGLNQSVRLDLSAVAFHVHVAEVRAFLKDVPLTPVQAVPDPWCEGGTEASAEDLDGDGKKETVRLQAGFDLMSDMMSGPAEATFIDLDEDEGKAARTEARPFAADVVLLRKHGELFAWYDTDNNGQFDVLLRDKEADGTVDIAWRIDSSGHYAQDKSLDKMKTIDIGLVKDASLHPRLAAVAGSLGWDKIASDATMAVADNLSVPDIFSGSVENAIAQSAEGPNEKPIIVYAMGPVGQTTYVDTRSDSLSHLKSGDNARSIIEKKDLKPQFVALSRPNGRWALYDSTDDGKIDVALFAKNPYDKDDPYAGAALYVTDAFDISGASPQRLAVHLGRSLIRPKLMPNEKVRRAVAMRDPGDDGRNSFPRAYAPGGRGAWRFNTLGGQSRRVLEHIDRASAVAMIDLAGLSKGAATKSADDFVREQSWAARVIFYRMGRLAWAFYDTDKDGIYDEVLFCRDLSKPKVDAAFRLNRAGDSVTLLPAVTGTVFQPDLVTKNPKEAVELSEVWDRVSHREKIEKTDRGK